MPPTPWLRRIAQTYTYYTNLYRVDPEIYPLIVVTSVILVGGSYIAWRKVHEQMDGTSPGQTNGVCMGANRSATGMVGGEEGQEGVGARRRAELNAFRMQHEKPRDGKDVA